jgi:hypothetical protein
MQVKLTDLRTTSLAALGDGNAGEAVLVPALDDLVLVAGALAGQVLQGLGHLGGDLLVLGAPLLLAAELLLNLDGQGVALLAGGDGGGDAVAGHQQLGLGEDALLGAAQIGLLLAVQVAAQTAHLVLQQGGGVDLQLAAVELDDHQLGLQDDHAVLGPGRTGKLTDVSGRGTIRFVINYSERAMCCCYER